MKNKIILAIIVIATTFGTYKRVMYAELASIYGSDFITHELAVDQMRRGVNPYIHTLDSYALLDRTPNEKGYAYLPGILYMNMGIFGLFDILNPVFTNMRLPVLMQYPGIIADLLIVLVLYKVLFKRSPQVALFCILYWIFNPYIMFKHSMGPNDSVAIALMMWALYYLEKNDVKSALLYAGAIIYKTFPIILLLVFLFKAKDKVRFILVGLLAFLATSIPFMKTIEDFMTYLEGAFLVHSKRFVQGRPYLYYISYYYKIEFFRIIPFRVYSMLSIVSGWLSTLLLYIDEIIHKVGLNYKIIPKQLKNKYVLSIFPFLGFYLFTPVLNRTYVLWGIPVFLIGSYFLVYNKTKLGYYILNLTYYVFLSWYLVQWKDGFHIWFPV